MRTPLLTVLTLLATAAPAAAQATATVNPGTPGAASSLAFDVDTSVAPVMGRVPTGIVLTLQPGFVLDPAAVTGRCTADQGAAEACPADSKIGSASVDATAFAMPVSATLNLYAAAPQQPGDTAGIIASGEALGQKLSAPGRVVITGDGSTQVIINTPAALSAFASSITVNRVKAQTDPLSRTVVKTKRVKIKHKHRKPTYKTKVVSRTKHDLITNPPGCNAGTWSASAAFTFGDGTTATLDAPLSCG